MTEAPRGIVGRGEGAVGNSQGRSSRKQCPGVGRLWGLPAPGVKDRGIGSEGMS